MGNKHEVNYKLIFTVLTAISIFAVLLTIIVWKKDLPAGILVTILFIAAEIYSVRQLFVAQRVISVTVDPAAIMIEYRKASVKVPYEDCDKIEHYKHGPLTERIFIYAKNYIYEIPFDLKGSHDLCKSIYIGLSKINMEYVADEWFQKKFGEEASPKGVRQNAAAKVTTDIKNNNTANKYSANYLLIWILMIVQFIFALFLTVIIWNREDIIFMLVWAVIILFIEYLGVLAVTSPGMTKSITITESNIVIEFKKKSIDIPVTSCETIIYQRPWPLPKRVYIYTGKNQYAVLPWYIRNFRGMCRRIYQVLENAKMESIADKSFQKKYGNLKNVM